jgi:phosphotransferase system HPr (HPr) family protein
MIRRDYIVKCESGLHARPASELVEMVQKYESEITIIYPQENMEANAKSIISLLSLGADKGAEVVIQAEGNDEAQVVPDIIALLDSIVE